MLRRKLFLLAIAFFVASGVFLGLSVQASNDYSGKSH